MLPYTSAPPSLAHTFLPSLPQPRQVPGVVSSPVRSPTRVQFKVPACIHRPCFVIIKPPLLGPLSLIYVTCMVPPPSAAQGLTLFCPRPSQCVSVSVCSVYMSMWACVRVRACMFVHLCMCVHAGPWSAQCVCVCVYVKEKFACPCLSEWLGLS